jgi:hypothetical protein
MDIGKYIKILNNGIMNLNNNKSVNIILVVMFVFYSAHISGDNHVPNFLFVLIENPVVRLASFAAILIVMLYNFRLGLLLTMAYCLTILTYDKQMGDKIVSEGFTNFGLIMGGR